MSRAIAAQTSVAYIVETTDGTTPTDPEFTTFRATGESLSVERKLVFSSELNGKRGQKNYALAGKMGSGSLNFEWTDGTLEDFLESALRGAWSTDVLTDANTPKSFTLETRFETGATDTFKRLKGAQVNTLAITASAQEIVTGSVGFMARKADFADAIETNATYVAGNTEAIICGDKVGSITASGLTLNGVHTVSLNLNNNLQPRLVLGSLEADELAARALEVTGTLGLYLSADEFDVLTAFQDATSTSLSFTLGTATGKKTTFSLPNIVLENPQPQAETAEGDVLLNLNFRALQASSLSGGVISITRNVA